MRRSCSTAAERKQAEAAIPGLQQAAATFKEAIALSQEAAPALPPDRHWDAYFGLVRLMLLQPLCFNKPHASRLARSMLHTSRKITT